MRYSLAAIALVGAASALSPSTAAASSCVSSYTGVFEISTQNVSSTKRDLTKRAPLMLTLADGILKDADGRIGYIAANNQFQFDNPVQAGTIYDAGWAVCSNNTLVLGPDAVFQECLSGTFYNLYDENSAAQCTPVYLDVVSSGTGASEPDGQVTASPISQITDGQPQAPTAVVSQITDGQIQAPQTTAAVVTEYSDGQPQAPQKTTAAVVSEYSDGQPQVPTISAAPSVPTNGTTPIYSSKTVSASATAATYTGGASHAGLALPMLFGGLLFAL